MPTSPPLAASALSAASDRPTPLTARMTSWLATTGARLGSISCRCTAREQQITASPPRLAYARQHVRVKQLDRPHQLGVRHQGVVGPAEDPVDRQLAP